MGRLPDEAVLDFPLALRFNVPPHSVAEWPAKTTTRFMRWLAGYEDERAKMRGG